MITSTFETIQDYNNAATPTETRISKILSDGSIIVDFVGLSTNQSTLNPQLGDLLYLDESNEKVFITKNTYVKASIPSGWTFVGVVFKREGNKAKILYRGYSSSYFFNAVLLGVYGYTLDGTTRTENIAIKFSSVNSGTDTIIPVTYNATTKQQFAEQLSPIIHQAAIDAGISESSLYWWAYYDDLSRLVIIQADGIISGTNQFNSGDNSYTLKAYITNGVHRGWNVNYSSRIKPKNRNIINISNPILNFSKAVEYYTTNGATPTSNLTLTNNTSIVNKNSFDNSSYCSTLRSTYGTYENYLRVAFEPEFPLILPITYLPVSEKLASLYATRRIKNHNGEIILKFPCMKKVYDINFNHDELKTGKWRLPDIDDVAILYEDSNIAVLLSTFLAANYTPPVLLTSHYVYAAQLYSQAYMWTVVANRGTLGASSNCYSRRYIAVTTVEI